MKESDKKLFLEELKFKLEFIKESENDAQIIELKKHKYEMITKEDLILEYENEALTVNRFLNAAVAQEDFEYCAVLRDYMTLSRNNLQNDLLTYYTLTDEDQDTIERLTKQTLK